MLCRLDSAGNLKVSDFGLGEDVYTTGYFWQRKSVHAKLPYKWMSPESLEDGVFSEKSDVVRCNLTLYRFCFLNRGVLQAGTKLSSGN